jgi:hypothetical protein
VGGGGVWVWGRGGRRGGVVVMDVDDKKGVCDGRRGRRVDWLGKGRVEGGSGRVLSCMIRVEFRRCCCKEGVG